MAATDRSAVVWLTSDMPEIYGARFPLPHLFVRLSQRGGCAYLLPHLPSPESLVETHGPLGTLWAGLGLGFFFLALTWLNLLLGHFLTPLFLIPATWLMDSIKRRKAAA